MKLTNECKEKFEEWVLGEASINSLGFLKPNAFHHFTDAMKFTVYVDFFLNQGIVIDIEPFMDYNEDSYTKVLYWRYNIIVMNKDNGSSKEIKTVEKARIKAIKKANKLYNENNNKT